MTTHTQTEPSVIGTVHTLDSDNTITHTPVSDSSTTHTPVSANTTTHRRREPGGFGRMPFGGSSDNKIIKEFGRKGFGDMSTPHTENTDD